MVDNRR